MDHLVSRPAGRGDIVKVRIIKRNDAKSFRKQVDWIVVFKATVMVQNLTAYQFSTFCAADIFATN